MKEQSVSRHCRRRQEGGKGHDQAEIFPEIIKRSWFMEDMGEEAWMYVLMRMLSM